MLSSSMITIVFRLINFTLFIILLTYLFKRYVYDALLAQMADRDKVRAGLEEKKELLAQVQSQLDEQMHTNERVYKELSATVRIWQQSFEQKQQELQQEKARIKHDLELKMEYRREEQFLNCVQDAVVTPAIEETKKSLHDYFAQPNHGKAYIKNIITYMESKI